MQWLSISTLVSKQTRLSDSDLAKELKIKDNWTYQSYCTISDSSFSITVNWKDYKLVVPVLVTFKNNKLTCICNFEKVLWFCPLKLELQKRKVFTSEVTLNTLYTKLLDIFKSRWNREEYKGQILGLVKWNIEDSQFFILDEKEDSDITNLFESITLGDDFNIDAFSDFDHEKVEKIETSKLLVLPITEKRDLAKKLWISPISFQSWSEKIESTYLTKLLLIWFSAQDNNLSKEETDSLVDEINQEFMFFNSLV